MTREEIIRMTREAGGFDATPEFLERFAALVAAAERERIRQANAPVIEKINAHINALAECVAAEREACAKVCEAQIQEWVDDRPRYAVSECATAIRARGEK